MRTWRLHPLYETNTTASADWSVLEIPGVMDRAETAARSLAGDDWGLPTHQTREDVYHDALVHLATHAAEARHELARGGLRFLYVWLWSDLHNSLKAARRDSRMVDSLDKHTDKAREIEARQETEGPRVRATAPSPRAGGDFYSVELVEHLLPAVVYRDTAYGMTGLAAPEPGMPKGQCDPARGGTLFAHLADIRTAWDRAVLPLDQRKALFLHIVVGWAAAEVAQELGCSERTVNRYVERGLSRMTDYLNGSASPSAAIAPPVAA
jgi:RNA polymerase sigma factor (sigma-70 family)